MHERGISKEAMEWIGTPFHHRAACKGVGADCFGLVYGVLRECGQLFDLQWPKYDAPSAQSPYLGLGIRTLDPHFALEASIANDRILLFELSDARWHMGIATGAQQFVHAHNRFGVINSAFEQKWQNALRRIYRVFEG